MKGKEGAELMTMRELDIKKGSSGKTLKEEGTRNTGTVVLKKIRSM